MLLLTYYVNYNRVFIDYWDNISDEDTDDIEDECIHNADVHRLTEVIDQLNPDDRHFIYLAIRWKWDIERLVNC